jgi:glucokinase
MSTRQPIGLALGLHLSSRAARAVLVDAAGTVAARGLRELSSPLAGRELGALARAVMHDARAKKVTALGLAVAEAESAAASAAIEALRSEFPASRSFPSGAAHAAAEVWCGAARGLRHVVTLSIGDDISAGIILDGRPWTGAHGLAGSAAWLALNPVERQDYRKFGCLDAEVSSRGIARRLVWRIQAGDHSAVLERAGDLDAIAAGHVFEGARTRDGVAVSVVRDTAKYVGMAVANLAVAFDPEVIILGGLIASAGDLLLDPVRQESLRRVPPAMADHLKVELSPLGEDASAIGAAWLAVNAP